MDIDDFVDIEGRIRKERDFFDQRRDRVREGAIGIGRMLEEMAGVTGRIVIYDLVDGEEHVITQPKLLVA